VIGWVLLSRQAVARAAEALEGENRGVRDEVGFLSLHQAIADRLFPGTSVLHTRARYALLVPWVMQRVAEAGPRDAERRLRQAEGLLAAQLVLGQDAGLDSDGAIGARIWRRSRRAPAQPPSFSYWTALSRWEILVRRPGEPTPSRSQVLRQLARASRARPSGEDDPAPSDGATSPFVALPRPPVGFGDPARPLDLALTAEERRFLRRQLIGVLRDDGAQSYLARLVEAGARGNAAAPWSPSVARHADQADWGVLELARGAAALAAVGRAVYAALTEAAHAGDGHPASTRHALGLEAIRQEFEDDALGLDLGALADSFPVLPADLREVMRQTQAWLRQGAEDPAPLRGCYAAAEKARKGDRARLRPTAGGRQRRAEWDPKAHPTATPLNYRWPNVARLLKDLAG
jgi:hypothetical protein